MRGVFLRQSDSQSWFLMTLLVDLRLHACSQQGRVGSSGVLPSSKTFSVLRALPKGQMTLLTRVQDAVPAGLLVLGLLPSEVGVGHAQAPRDIASHSLASVVLIATDDADGQPLALGSGFLVSQGIVTNMHVVRGAARGTAKLVAQQKVEPLAGIVALDTLHDLVLLAAPGVVAPMLQLGDSRAMAIGDEIYALGNPQGLEGTFSQGIISGIRRLGGDTLLQITAPISPGSSGGPVLNGKGEVVGVAVASFREGQNLNFAIPAAYVALLLRHVSATPQPLSALRYRSRNNGRGRVEAGTKPPVEGILFSWSNEYPVSAFTFSLRNRLEEPVTNVVCLVIFYDGRGKPIDLTRAACEHSDSDQSHSLGVVPGTSDTIPPGLARRYSGLVDESVPGLTGRVEIRVLDFSIVHR